MASQISYTPPALQVIREEVCFRTPASSDVLRGFHVVSYMGDEEVQRKLESLDGTEVKNYELCACPITVQQQINNKQVIVLRNRNTLKLVYAINVVNDNGSVTTTYINIDGSVYEGDINELEIAADNLNYSSPVVFCHEGSTTLTRTDVWDETQKLVAIIWQDAIGKIVAEPTGTLRPGACELPLDTEVLKQVDNLMVNGKPSGEYVTFYRVNVHDNTGAVIFSGQKLANGNSYLPIGKVTFDPIQPPVVAYLRRLTNGETWESSSTVQSASFAIEYVNKNNVIEVTTADSSTPVVFSKLNYKGHWSVDGDKDPNIEGIKISAKNNSKVLVNWTEQPRLIEVVPSGLDVLDAEIDIPAELEGEGYGAN
jgi:hypothetical protein